MQMRPLFRAPPAVSGAYEPAYLCLFFVTQSARVHSTCRGAQVRQHPLRRLALQHQASRCSVLDLN